MNRLMTTRKIKLETANLFDWLNAHEIYPKIFWQNRANDFTLAGLGAAIQIKAAGTDRYKAVFTEFHKLAEHDPGIQLFGGFSFFENPPIEKDWQDFGSCNFIIPQVSITGTDKNYELHVKDTDDNQINIEDYLKNIDTLPSFEKNSQPKIISHTDTPDKTTWMKNIEKAQKKFAEKKLQKIVLARRTTLEFDKAIDPWSLLNALQNKFIDSFVFALQINLSTAFVSITPERLFLRNDRKLHSESLAGTRPRGTNPDKDRQLEQELLNSTKDVQEHAFVTSMLQHSLDNICDNVAVGGLTVKKSSHVQHLYRSIEGTLKNNIDDAQIISQLHPTPAVGGLPREQALAEIAKLEPFERGWYAAPVGCIGQNRTELAVAIRSVLITGNRVHLYAGAGIVPDSDPEREWQELENKLQTYLKLFEVHE